MLNSGKLNMTPTDPLILCLQNIKDRYYGVNDPVADKIMKRADTLPTLDPPEDPHITTLYIGGLDETFTEKVLRDHFYQFGELRQVRVKRLFIARVETELTEQ